MCDIFTNIDRHMGICHDRIVACSGRSFLAAILPIRMMVRLAVKHNTEKWQQQKNPLGSFLFVYVNVPLPKTHFSHV